VVYCAGFVSEADCGNPAVTLGKTFYYYDGEGRRVGKVSGAVTQVFVYDAQGRLAAEYGGSSEVSGTHYVTADHLGTTRVITDPSKAVIQCRDYLPFGDELLATAQNGRNGIPCYSGETGLRQKFTGKERDAESRLDYLGARYYSWAAGRFTSPDEWTGGIVDPFTGKEISQPGPLPYADITDPQTINKYAYVRNNPLRYTDPDGHAIDIVADVAFLTYDLNQIRREGFTVENSIGLGGDILGAALPFATALGPAARGGYRLAKSGEWLEHAAQTFTGLSKNFSRILQGTATSAKYRIPDLLSSTTRFIGEAKGAAKLSLTRQFRDLFKYTKETNSRFSLFIGAKAELSRPLLEAVDQSKTKVYRYVDNKWKDVTKELLKRLEE